MRTRYSAMVVTMAALILTAASASAHIEWEVYPDTLHLGDNGPGTDCYPPVTFGMEYEAEFAPGVRVVEGVFSAWVSSVADIGAKVYYNGEEIGTFPISSNPGDCQSYDHVVFPIPEQALHSGNTVRIVADGPNPEDRDDIWLAEARIQVTRAEFEVGTAQTIDFYPEFPGPGVPFELTGFTQGIYLVRLLDGECPQWYPGSPCYGNAMFAFFNVESYLGFPTEDRDLIQAVLQPGPSGEVAVGLRDHGSLYAWLVDRGASDNKGRFVVSVTELDPAGIDGPERGTEAFGVEHTRIEVRPNPGRAVSLRAKPGVYDGGILRVYDTGGRLIRTWKAGDLADGREILWNGDDMSGRRVPSGVYYYSYVGKTITDQGKVCILK